MEKHIGPFVLTACMLLAGCQSPQGSSSTSATISDTSSSATSVSESSETVDPGIIGEVNGLENTTAVVGHYFDPFKNVSAVSTTGIDITDYLNVSGTVDYGTVGTYALQYSLSYQDTDYTKTRYVEVQTGTYIPPVNDKIINDDTSVSLGEGSYRTGTAGDIAHPAAPAYLEADLQAKPVPTNGWWTTLLTQNYGGGNGIYLNPLRSSLSAKGLEITNVGKGFVQYWNVNNTPTMAQFSPFYQDLMLRSSYLNSSYTTKVVNYSDNNVKVALRNSDPGEDQMMVTYTQGSPFVFAEFNHKDGVTLKVDTAGVDSYQYFDLSGNEITDTYQGEAIILRMIRRHVGYATALPDIVGGAVYEDRYFLVNAPKETLFRLVNVSHPAGYKDQINLTLGNGNYLSICALQNASEGTYYHNHAYTFLGRASSHYIVNHETNVVTTTFRDNLQQVMSDKNALGLLALLPHQYKTSLAPITDYTFRTVRGTLKMMEGNTFETLLNFRGMLPGFSLPSAASFNRATAVSYLQDLDSRTGLDDEDLLGSSAPYWNAKALYPLSQGLMIADQLGETALKNAFILKIESLLVDWFTYQPAVDEDRYLYYNQTWGTTYYSDNTFSTASELSDHHFTHGYLVYAASVLAMYDTIFYQQYHDIIDFLLKDYMTYNQGNDDYPTLRCFDAWAGHSWAHGYGFFTEGNNQESCGEALNSWVAGYLFGLEEGDASLVDAAIYGFVTELYSVKQYWFNYDEDNWSAEYANYQHVAGMVWGGKFDYATWFGANPSFIYGIHWLPTGEYLTSYALGSTDKAMLNKIYSAFLTASGGSPKTWYSNMWAVQSLVNPTLANSNFSAASILADDYPDELSGSYWMVQAMQTLGTHSAQAYMSVDAYAAGSVYEGTSGLTAMVWNPSGFVRTVTFRNASGVLTTREIPAHSFAQYSL